MICTDIDGYRFLARAGGLAVQGNKVLLNRNCAMDFWFMPGGRIEGGEDSRATIAREMKEEIGQDVEVGRLRCVLENFFRENGRKYHEISFYYDLVVPESWEGRRYIRDGEAELEYAWFDLDELPGLRLYPALMKGIIAGSENGIHYVIRE